MAITSETPLRDIVVERPAAIPVLEDLGIDYCCGGKQTLGEACLRGGLSVSRVLSALSERQPGSSEVNWETARLSQLIEHIVVKHHTFARGHLRLLGELAAKVERRHGGQHPEVLQVNQAIAALTTETTRHFFCEEDMLFPYIQALETGAKSARSGAFSSIEQPVTRMLMDHDHTGDELKQLRAITGSYQPPPDACTTFRALYRGLEELELDLHQHIHLENNILFPRALAMAREQA